MPPKKSSKTDVERLVRVARNRKKRVIDSDDESEPVFEYELGEDSITELKKKPPLVKEKLREITQPGHPAPAPPAPPAPPDLVVDPRDALIKTLQKENADLRKKRNRLGHLQTLSRFTERQSTLLF